MEDIFVVSSWIFLQFIMHVIWIDKIFKNVNHLH